MVIARTKLPAELVVARDFNAQQLQKLNAVGIIAEPLFKEYLLAFELTSVLLLVAIAGAVVLDGGGRQVLAESLALTAALFIIGVIGSSSIETRSSSSCVWS